MKKKLLLIALLVLTLSYPLDSFAKFKGEVRAEKDFLWSTLIRYVRVDLNFEIIEKDSDGGYLIFKYKDLNAKVACRSTVEIIPDSSPQKKKAGLTLQVSIPCAGMVQEKLLIDGLIKKIEEEK